MGTAPRPRGRPGTERGGGASTTLPRRPHVIPAAHGRRTPYGRNELSSDSEAKSMTTLDGAAAALAAIGGVNWGSSA